MVIHTPAVKHDYDRAPTQIITLDMKMESSVISHLSFSVSVFQDGTPLQAFVAQVQNQLVGIVIIRNEEVVFLFTDFNGILLS